jgi:hypothetical protein
LNHLGWVVDGSYQIGGAEFGIRCTSKEIGEQLDRVLSDYYADKAAPAVYSLVVSDGSGNGSRPGRKFHVLYRFGTALVKSLYLPTVLRALFSELESLTFSERDDAIFANAGLVGSNGSLALGPGSLSLILDRLGRRVQRAGLRFSPSRFVAIDPRSGKVIPMPSQLEFPRSALNRLERLATGDRVDDRHGLVLEGPTSLDAVFDYADAEALEPISRALVVTRLARTVTNFPKFGKAALETLAQLVQGTPCLALGKPDNRAILAAISSVMTRS